MRTFHKLHNLLAVVGCIRAVEGNQSRQGEGQSLRIFPEFLFVLQNRGKKDGERSCGFTGAFAVFSPNTTNFSKLAYVKLLYSAMLKVK